MTARDLPCVGQGDLMQDPSQEQTAKYVCMPCPRMYACRAWAVRTDVDGVCGGLTPLEREQWREFADVKVEAGRTWLPLQILVRDEYRRQNPRTELLEAVDDMSARHSAHEIGQLLGVSQRQVVRLRSSHRERAAS